MFMKYPIFYLLQDGYKLALASSSCLAQESSMHTVDTVAADKGDPWAHYAFESLVEAPFLWIQGSPEALGSLQEVLGCVREVWGVLLMGPSN